MSYREEILNRPVGIEEGGAHGLINLIPRETHTLHIGNSCFSFASEGQCGWIVETSGIGRLLGRSG